MTLKQLEKQIDQKLKDGLKQLGFSGKAKHIYQREFDNGKLGLIIIEKTDRRTKTTWFANPTIAFVHNEIEQLAQVVAREFYGPNYIINTVFQSLGYFTPEREYLTWDFTLDDKEAVIDKKIQSLVKTIDRHALQRMEQLCDDHELLKVMRENEIGLEATNRVKAAVLLYLMGRRQEALDLAKQTIGNIRPSPKDPSIQEPDFATGKDAFAFFRRDKDAIYYFNYIQFYKRFLEYDKAATTTNFT